MHRGPVIADLGGLTLTSEEKHLLLLMTRNWKNIFLAYSLCFEAQKLKRHFLPNHSQIEIQYLYFWQVKN